MKIIEDSHVHPTVRQQFTDEGLLELMRKHCRDNQELQIVTIDTDRNGINNLLRREEAPGEIYLGIRGSRKWVSPVVLARGVPTSLLTLVVGPQGTETVLYTAYWGNPAPREPRDPNLQEKDRDESMSFWSEHILCVDEYDTTVINLSGRDILVSEEDRSTFALWRSPQVAKVLARPAQAWRIGPGNRRSPVLGLGVELHDRTPQINNLPPPCRGAIFVVSSDVRWALGTEDRPDVLSVGRSYYSNGDYVCLSWHSCHDYT